MAPYRSLKYRIAIVIFVLEGIMMTSVLWLSSATLTNALLDQRAGLDQVLTQFIAQICRSALLTDEYTEVNFYFSHLQKHPRIDRAILLNAAGTIVASADVRDIGQTFKLHNDKPNDYRYEEVIANASGALGTLSIVYSNRELFHAINRARDFGLVIAVIGMVIIAIVGVGIGAFLTRRLHHLSATVRQISSGDIQARVGLGGADEVGELSQAFDRMADLLATERAQLERSNIELETRVLQRTADLQLANQELESFSYSVSHDLRAPLRAIDGFGEMLLEDYATQLDLEGQNHINRMRINAQKMKCLIDYLLSLSRVTRTPLQIEKVNLSAIAEKIVDDLRRAHPGRQVTVTIAADVHASCDAGLLTIALENLIGNAWKYTGKTANATITFDSVCQDSEVIYRIADNGAGFDMEMLEKLFVAFQRLHGKEEFEGTGIGLATVARIIRRHGGRVWATAEVGKGASFCFTLDSSQTLN